MAEISYGHFGRASVVVAGLALLALLVHLIIPYGYLEHGPAAGPEDKMVSRGEYVDWLAIQDPAHLEPSAHPNVALAGLIIAMAGTALVAIMGFQPLTVIQARWIAVSGSGVAVVGTTMAFMQSMYSVGTGFASFWTHLMGGEFDLFYAVSPFFVAGMSMVMLRLMFSVMQNVVSAAGGLRQRTSNHMSVGWWGVLLLGAVLMMPWVTGQLHDGIDSRYGGAIPGSSTAPFFFSAEDIQGMTAVEAEQNAPRYFQSSDWTIMQAGIVVMVTLGWFAILNGVIAAFVGVAISSGSQDNLEKLPGFLQVGTALLTVACAIMYTLCWVMVKPNGDVSETFTPGFFPLLVLIPGILLATRFTNALKYTFDGANPA